MFAAARAVAPGLALAFLAAGAAVLVSLHTPVPAVLAALVIGMVLAAPAAQPAFAPGAAYSARFVLRFGVLLLGARVSLGDIADLGWQAAALTLAILAAVYVSGLVIGRWCGLTRPQSAIAAAAVAVCGASAALAAAAALSRKDEHDRDAAGTVALITVVGSAAMVLYPLLARFAGLSDAAAGFFLGASLHEVVQAVGGGYAFSDLAGDAATTVKLVRVAAMAPLVILITAMARREAAADDGLSPAKRPPLVPWFLAGFVALVALQGLGVIPAPLAAAMAEISRWCLLAAIAALGMKITPRGLAAAGRGPLAAILGMTAVCAALAFGGALLIG